MVSKQKKEEGGPKPFRMIDVLLAIFLTVNVTLYTCFGVTVGYTAYKEEWECCSCLHRRKRRKRMYVGVPDESEPVEFVAHTVELGVREPDVV